MADGKIYITISDTRGGSGAGVSNDADSGGKNQKSIGKFFYHKFTSLVESEAKQIINYTVGNIGNFTGNYQAQRDIQVAVNIVSDVINIGTSAVGAFVAFGGQATGGIAAAIVVSTALVSKGFSTGMEIYKDSFENKKTNRNIEYMRLRLGLEGLIDGSRTGGY